MSRPGSGLAEVLVALGLVSLGLLTAAATGNLAAAWLRIAEAEQDAAGLAAHVADSLLLAPDLAPGELRDGRFLVRWSVAARGPSTRLDIIVDFTDGGRARSLAFSTLHASPVPWPDEPATP